MDHKLGDIIEPKKQDPDCKRNISVNSRGFMIEKELELDIKSNPFMAPYELVKLYSDMEIKKIDLGDHNANFAETLTAEEKELYAGASI